MCLLLWTLKKIIFQEFSSNIAWLGYWKAFWISERKKENLIYASWVTLNSLCHSQLKTKQKLLSSNINNKLSASDFWWTETTVLTQNSSSETLNFVHLSVRILLLGGKISFKLRWKIDSLNSSMEISVIITVRFNTKKKQLTLAENNLTV